MKVRLGVGAGETQLNPRLGVESGCLLCNLAHVYLINMILSQPAFSFSDLAERNLIVAWEVAET